VSREVSYENMKALEEDNERLRLALDRYARHKWKCPMFNPSQRDREAAVKCDCEAKAALEALNLPTHC